MVDLDLTKRQKEIFDFIRKLRGEDRLPADGAGDRQGGRACIPPRPCTRTWRTSRRSACCAATLQAARDRAALRQGEEDDPARAGLPLVGQVAAGEPILAEENIEEYIEIPDVIGGEDGDYILQVRGESMKDAGILEGDYVIVRPSRRRRQRRDRRRPDRRGGDRQALLPRNGPHPAAARERGRWSRSTPPRPSSSAASIGVFRRSERPRFARAILAASWSLASLRATIGGRAERTAGGEKTPRGKSGHHRAGRWVTPTRGNPRESATETHGRWRGHT